MEKTLNDSIDSVFRGIVFIILNFATSAFRLLVAPGRGCVLMVRRLYARDIEQVRPFVFLFICIFVTAITPMLLDAATVKDDPNTYKIYMNGVLQQQDGGAARHVYQSIFDKIETKEMFVLLLCSVVGVSVFHVCSGLLARISFTTATRRQIGEDCWSYVIGAQILLLLVVYLVNTEFGWPPYDPGSGEAPHLVSSLTHIFSNNQERQHHVWLSMLEAVMLLLIAVFPIPITRALLRRRRRLRIELKFSETGRHRAWLGAVVLSVAAIDLILATSLFTAAFAQKQLRGSDPLPYIIQENSLACTIEKHGEEAQIKSIMIVTVTGKRPWLFNRDDYSYYVSATRTKADPIANSKRPLYQDPARVGRGQIKAAFAPPTASGRLLVEPGHSAAIGLEAKLDASYVRFLSEHPDKQRCTVSSVTNDFPVGAGAPLIEREDTATDPPKGGTQN